MQLLYPIGLLALAGLIIPVLIHLWSVKQGKTLKIGSIALLGESASATSKSFKITDWLLFVLRCLLIIFAAFILTEPFFSKKNKINANTGWIIAKRNEFKNVYQNQQKTIDSLLSLGYQLRDFAIGFNEFKLADTSQKFSETDPISYNSLLKKLNTIIPAGYKAYIFTDKKQRNFNGDVPQTSFKLVWKEIKRRDTLKTWSTQFLGKNYQAKSTPYLTEYMALESVNLPSVTVAIYEPLGNDAKYVKAALSAIEDYIKIKIKVKSLDLSSTNQADLVFWLSEQAIDPYIAKLTQNAKVFIYQKGRIENLNSTVLLTNIDDGAPVKLYKHIKANNQKGKAVWVDSFGEPLLLNETKDKLNYFYFYSRLNPQWTDLVWNEQFVNALMPIVLSDQGQADFGFEANALDQRTIAANQGLTISAQPVNAIKTQTKNQSLTQLVWVLALITLLIERILSFRKTRLQDVKN